MINDREYAARTRQAATLLWLRPNRKRPGPKPRGSLFALLAPLLAAYGWCQPVTSATSGSLQGKVSAEDGSPLGGALVSYTRVARTVRVGHHFENAPGESLVSSVVTAGPNGAFSVGGIAAGLY